MLGSNTRDRAVAYGFWQMMTAKVLGSWVVTLFFFVHSRLVNQLTLCNGP